MRVNKDQQAIFNLHTLIRNRQDDKNNLGNISLNVSSKRELPATTVPNLNFTQDARGKGYESVEKGIAADMIRRKYFANGDNSNNALNGPAYTAKKGVIAYGLASSDVHDQRALPEDWHRNEKGVNDLYKKITDQYANPSQKPTYDKQGNALKPSLAVDAARDFHQQQLSSGRYNNDNRYDIPELKNKSLGEFNDRDKVTALRDFARRPLGEDPYKPSNMQNFLDSVNKLMVIDGLAAAGKDVLGLLEKKR